MATKKKIGTKKTTVTKRKYTKKKVEVENDTDKTVISAVPPLNERPVEKLKDFSELPQSEKKNAREAAKIFLAANELAESIHQWGINNEVPQILNEKDAFQAFQTGFLDFFGIKYMPQEHLDEVLRMTETIWKYWYFDIKTFEM